MDVSRRSLLAPMALPVPPVSIPLDHLLLGVPDLDQGTDWVRRRTGVAALAGGSHPGRGTRNALLSLGGHRYLEILAPDPAQSEYRFPVDVRPLAEPRLVNWAVRTPDIEAAARQARTAGCGVTGPLPGSRLTPDGATLRWKTLHVEHPFADPAVDPVPFFIEWSSGTAHPSAAAPPGCVFESLLLEHPRAGELADLLRRLGLAVDVKPGPAARISAALGTPQGGVRLS
jgi:hypothetical protein